MTKEQLKQAVLSIVIGAVVALLSNLLDVLATFLKSHATEVASGASATAIYLAKAYKA